MGAIGIGSPIYKMDNSVIGSICITVPQVRFDAGKEEQLSALVRKQAELLSRALGYQGLYPGK